MLEKLTLKSRRSYIAKKSKERINNWKKSVHESHDMTTWKPEIRSPAGTLRFYSVRKCKCCEAEQMFHSAGKFMDNDLLKECKGENQKTCTNILRKYL